MCVTCVLMTGLYHDYIMIISHNEGLSVQATGFGGYRVGTGHIVQ